MTFPARILLTASSSLRPRSTMLVSEWADMHRRLSGKASSEEGAWRTSRTPFLREPMDCLSLASPVRRVVLEFATQIGKTEVALNWVGYIMDHAPAPTLVVVPTVDPLRRRWVKQRLNPMLESTPRLTAIFDSKKRRDGGNSEDLKEFPGGLLILGGANSPASLSSMPIKYVILDEVDRFPRESGSEGDPIGLIDERQKTFPRRKTLLISTPTTEEESRIHPEFVNSDQRHYYVPCPHCGEYQHLEWSQIKAHASGAVTYECKHCAQQIAEHNKPAMLARGQWIPHNAGHAHRGYHLNGLYSPLGLGYTWAEAWAMWLAAQKDTRKLKRFVNTFLADIWRAKSEQVDATGLIARVEDYGDLDLRWIAITAGVDVQKDRLEATIYGWDQYEESWAIDHVIIAGDTEHADVWHELADLLEDVHSVDAAVIDAGYRPDKVKEFCADRDWAWPGKGIDGMYRTIVEDQRTRRQRLRKRRRNGMPIEPIGVDSAKSLLMSRLKLKAPGPGFVHFPNTRAFDDEFFAQLTAERLETTHEHGRERVAWVKVRPRNEALDCAVLALAALRLGVDFEAKLAEREKRDKAGPKPAAAPVSGFTARVIEAELY